MFQFRNWLFIIINCLLLVSSYAQESPFVLGMNGIKEKGYYFAIESLEQKRTYYTVDNPNFKQTFLQVMSTFYSFIGDDEHALKSFDDAFMRSDPIQPDRQEDSVLLPGNIVFINALDYIEKRARNEQIVIINESHMMPQHRILTKELLLRLAANGFTYLGVEGLSHEDTLINERGFPEVITSGFYVSEPVFGNLVRMGLNLHYKLFAYDRGPPCDYDKNKPKYCNNLRELFQAREISKVLNEDPKAKILIHCGLDHLQEKTSTDWIKMAEYLKILTGIDPLTVNQTKYTERGYDFLESDIYHSLARKYILNDPFICLKEGNAWVPEKYQGYFDVQVFWPRTSHGNGRPSYLHAQSGCQKYLLPKNKTRPNTLVQAFNYYETDNAVPIDQFLMTNKNVSYALFLPKGKFTVHYKDEDDMLLEKFDIIVK